MRWRCPLCANEFHGVMAQTAHMVNMYKSSTDQSRCDWGRFRNANVVATGAATAVAATVNPPVPIVNPVSAMPLTTLARRKPLDKAKAERARTTYFIPDYAGDYDIELARDMTGLQDAWERLVGTMKSSCSERF